MIYNSPLDLIGSTPLLKLSRMVRQNTATVYLKLEMKNLTGSVKDRAALSMIEGAETTGVLKKGATLIESTSGNLGVSLAALTAIKGYKFICVLDPKVEPAKIDLIKAYGAQVVIVSLPDEKGGYQKPRIQKVTDLLKTIPSSVNLDQYNNSDNPAAHRTTTGPEIYQDLRDKIDVLVGAVSTGGTLCSTAAFLKGRVPQIKVVGVEPVGSVVFGGSYRPYLQQGAGLSFVPGNFNGQLIDQSIKVTDGQAFATVRSLAKIEGILLGGSAGAVVFVALELARSMPKEKSIVAIAPDGGEKYIDTVFDDKWLTKNDIAIT